MDHNNQTQTVKPPSDHRLLEALFCALRELKQVKALEQQGLSAEKALSLRQQKLALEIEFLKALVK